MNFSRLLVLSSVALFTVVGCAAKATNTSSDGSLGVSEDALSTDDTDSQEAEDGSEDGVENGLSGAAPTDPGTPADGADIDAIDAIDAKIKTNPGKYFIPAGCLVSARTAAGAWTHVFTSCTGPGGKVSYNGTVTSTWTVAAGALSAKHEATDFVVKGPRVSVTMSGSRSVSYTRSGTVVTKRRAGSWAGKLTKNADATKSFDWSHLADFTSSWDPASKCLTRDGSASNSIGGRAFGRTVSGFKVCGGLFACPSSGELELDRKNGAVKMTVTFLGGQDVEITGPRGNTIKRKLACNAS